MTPDEFTAALMAIRWSQRHLAKILECDTNMPTRWARGNAQIPAGLAAWLRDLADYHKAVGMPFGASGGHSQV
jgi:hypothetical protein